MNPAFKGPGELNGVFSGLGGGQTVGGIGVMGGKYDKATWAFQKDAAGVVMKDLTLQSPNCVFQLLKKHYSRYTLEKVSQICGTPQDLLVQVYDLYATHREARQGGHGTVRHGLDPAHGRHPEHQGHGHRPDAAREHGHRRRRRSTPCAASRTSRVPPTRGCSSTSTPATCRRHVRRWQTLAKYNEVNTPVSKDPRSLNWWGNRPKYIASYIRAMYGNAEDLETQYQYLPKLDDTQSAAWLVLFDQHGQGRLPGLLRLGSEPGLQRLQLRTRSASPCPR